MTKTKIALVTVLALGAACYCNVSDQTLRRTTEAAGLHDARSTGKAYFGCGEGDEFRTHFEAKNASGTLVRGTVCCGFTKDCTVRYE